MAAKTQQLAPPVTHWFVPVKPVTVNKRPTAVALAVLVQPPKVATRYNGSLSAPVH